MSEVLQEFVDSRGVNMRVDRQRSVIRGVKLLGFASRNGREYLPAALAEAVGLYEGAKVNVNHPKGNPLAARDYQDRLGVVHEVALRQGEGLFGDLHFNPKHALAEQLLWDAEHAPENVGFSHNVQARTVQKDGKTIVEAILKVQSIDLVADPASTRGLFEAAAIDASAADEQATAGKQDFASKQVTPASIDQLTLEVFRRERPDLVEALLESSAAEVRALRGELDALRAAESQRERQAAIRSLLREFRLPDPDQTDPASRAITSDSFLESLLAAADDGELRRLVEERANLVASAGRWTLAPRGTAGKPLSREQNHSDRQLAPVANGESFARALKSGLRA